MRQWFGKFIRGKSFAVLFCMLGSGLTAYLSSRLGTLVEAFTAWNPRVWIFAALAVFSGYMLVYVNSSKEVKKSWKLFDLCGALFCLFPSMAICFLLFDAARVLLRLQDGRLYLIPLLLAAAVTGYGFVHARKLCVKEYQIPLAGGEMPRTMTAVLMSDLHVGSYVDLKQLRKIVAASNRAKPDMVVLAGDTFDQDAFDRCDKESVRKELQALEPKGQVYAVLGNHDPSSACREIRAFFEAAGIHLLVDACMETDAFMIAGRDDILGNPNRKPIGDLVGKQPCRKPLLVIDHNPLGIEDGIAQNAALVLCGHTHKGQFFPATLVTKLAYGPRGFYGHFQTGETHSVVSAGAGYFQLPVRIGTNSEIVVLHIALNPLPGKGPGSDDTAASDEKLQ